MLSWPGDEACLAWHASDGPPCAPYQRGTLSLRARSPHHSSGTPSRGISTHGRCEPCGKPWESNRWDATHLHCDCVRAACVRSQTPCSVFQHQSEGFGARASHTAVHGLARLHGREHHRRACAARRRRVSVCVKFCFEVVSGLYYCDWLVSSM